MLGSNESRENNIFRHQREDVHLPPEIILAILSRLPIESILRCRTVCKSWNNFTRDPFFINLQLSRANDQPKRIILQSFGAISRLYLVDVEMDKVRVVPEIPLIPHLCYGDLCITNSLDGWICMASRTSTFLLIYNLITAEYKILPENEHEDSWSVVFLCHQVCLGFDSSVKKYKVVRIYYYIDDDTGDEICRCEVITLGLKETNFWRVFSLPCRVLYKDCLGPVFTDGRMWWIMDKENQNLHDRKFILHFDLTSEAFGTVEFPSSIKAPVYRSDFPTCNLQLQIIGRYLVLLEYDGRSLHSWRIVPSQQDGHYSITFSSVDMLIPWDAKFFRSLVDMPHPNKMLLEMDGLMMGYDENNLVEYIPKSKVHIRLSIPGIPMLFRAISFNPSFLSIPYDFDDSSSSSSSS